MRLHDIFPATNPEWFRSYESFTFKKSLKVAIKNQAIFICNSNTTANSLKEFSPGMTNRVYVINCETENFKSENCENCDGCKLLTSEMSEKFALSVGTIEPRKNYSQLLELWKSGFFSYKGAEKLIIVGQYGWKCKRLKRELSQNIRNVLWIKKCCDGALGILYAKALFYVNLSFNEGFNIPAFEASHIFRKEMILSDIPIHRELYPWTTFLDLQSLCLSVSDVDLLDFHKYHQFIVINEYLIKRL